MKWYRLSYVMHEPSEETEDKYMAEIPDLTGCRAWGDTPSETLENLQSVAAATVEVYKERGYELPTEIKAALIDPAATNDVLVPV